jgi:hypothetical protein
LKKSKSILKNRLVNKNSPIIILCFFLFPYLLHSDWEKDLLTYLHSLEGERLENHYQFTIFTGISNCSDNYLNKKLYPESEQFFAPLFNIGIEYGFKRYDNNKKLLPYYLHSGERVFLENISSHFKPKAWEFDGQTIDAWKFGFATDNGIGIPILKTSFLELHHQTSFVWNRFDFEKFDKVNIIDAGIQKFDEKYKFGIEYSASINVPFSSLMSLEFQYQRNLVYPDFQFGKWFGSFLIENASQRWIDFYDKKFMERIGPEYYIYKFAYNTLISFLFSELKRGQSFAPFSSDPSLTVQSFKLRLNFVQSNN